MARLVIVLVVALLAGGVAVLLRRRRPGAALGPPQWNIPTVLARADFERPEAPWLVAVFTSATCDTCAAVRARAQVLEGAEVAVQEVEARQRRDLHERYQIDAVPLVAVADAGGAVRAHFLGPTTATDLWGALARLRADHPSPGDASDDHGPAGADRGGSAQGMAPPRPS
jgi:hypothetical protein